MSYGQNKVKDSRTWGLSYNKGRECFHSSYAHWKRLIIQRFGYGMEMLEQILPVQSNKYSDCDMSTPAAHILVRPF